MIGELGARSAPVDFLDVLQRQLVENPRTGLLLTGIGGSYAGMAAALQLARIHREVLVVDTDKRRNRFVDAAGGTSHGYLTQDGTPPAEIASTGKTQMLRYPNVQWLHGAAEDAWLAADGRPTFQVQGERIGISS